MFMDYPVWIYLLACWLLQRNWELGAGRRTGQQQLSFLLLSSPLL